MFDYFLLPLGNRSETETPRAWDSRRSSESETQRIPASILARVPRLMSQPARWHLPARESWERPLAVLNLAICLPVTFVGKGSVLRYRNLTLEHKGGEMCSIFGAFGGLLQMSKSRKIVVLFASIGLSLSAVPFCNPAHAREPSRPKFQSQSDDLIKSVTQKAEGGMAEAQMLLAKWRYDGSVLPEDHAEAARWYGMAANQENVEAMMALGRMLIEGNGVPRDIRKGSEWYVAAARKGDAEAYFQLGRIFEDGEGVNTDRGKALKLYIEAAKRGNANAAFQIAKIYDADSGADRNTEMRDHYLELAAELGCDAAKEMQSQIQDHAPVDQPPPADTDVSQVTSTAGMETGTGRSDGITEDDRRYDQELRRRAEEEWNEQSRNTGGLQFAGNAGSGQLDMSFQDRHEKEQQAIQREQRRQQLLQNPVYDPFDQANFQTQRAEAERDRAKQDEERKREEVFTPPVQASTDNQNMKRPNAEAHNSLLNQYERLSPIIDALTDIKAGVAVGINRMEFNRLQRQLASSIMRRQSDIENIMERDPTLIAGIVLVVQMCEKIEEVWDRMNENKTKDPTLGISELSLQNEYTQMILQVFPSSKDAIKWGYLTNIGYDQGWYLNMGLALPLMMNDTGTTISFITDTYNRGMRSAP